MEALPSLLCCSGARTRGLLTAPEKTECQEQAAVICLQGLCMLMLMFYMFVECLHPSAIRNTLVLARLKFIKLHKCTPVYAAFPFETWLVLGHKYPLFTALHGQERADPNCARTQ